MKTEIKVTIEGNSVQIDWDKDKFKSNQVQKILNFAINELRIKEENAKARSDS